MSEQENVINSQRQQKGGGGPTRGSRFGSEEVLSGLGDGSFSRMPAVEARWQ